MSAQPPTHHPPVIGITTYGRREHDAANRYYDTHYAVPAAYVDAVRRGGGVPILLPPGEPHWERWLDVIDGLIISGGADVDPTSYAGNPHHPTLTVLDPERDQTELALARTVADQGVLPTLCICRGLQVLNVALGGTLHEDIGDIRAEDIHRNGDGGWTVQPVAVQPDSRLGLVMGANVATHSGHHQAVNRIGAGLQPTAFAPDGLIEALEHASHPWLVAVQWHPEVSAATDAGQQHLFDELVRATADNRRPHAKTGNNHA